MSTIQERGDILRQIAKEPEKLGNTIEQNEHKQIKEQSYSAYRWVLLWHREIKQMIDKLLK